jgi:hypothetical protein
MSNYNSGNAPNSNDILSLLDDLENKLNRHKPGLSSYVDNSKAYKNYGSNLYQYQDAGYKSPYDKGNLYQINSNPSPLQLSSPSNEYLIRKIIKDEFSSLIIPYQQDVHNNINILEAKINNNTSNIKELKSKNLGAMSNLLNKGGMGFSFNDLDFGKNQNIENNNLYVLRDEYNNKISEIETRLMNLEGGMQGLKQSLDNNNFMQNNQFSKMVYNNNM